MIPVGDITQCSTTPSLGLTVQMMHTCDITINYHSTFWGLIDCGV